MSVYAFAMPFGLQISFCLYTDLKLPHHCSTSVDFIPHCFVCLRRRNAPSNIARYDGVNDTYCIRKHVVMYFHHLLISSTLLAQFFFIIYRSITSCYNSVHISVQCFFRKLILVLSPFGFVFCLSCEELLSTHLLVFSCGRWGESPVAVGLPSFLWSKLPQRSLI